MRRTNIRILTATLAVAALVVVPLPRHRQETAAAQVGGSGRTLTASKTLGLVDDEEITVSWSGFTPGPAYLLQCKTGSPEWYRCADHLRVTVVTGADGTGSTTFKAQSGALANSSMGAANAAPACFGATNPFGSCELVLTECEFDVAPARTARLPLDFVAPYPPAPQVQTIIPALPNKPEVLPQPAPATTEQRGPDIRGIGSSSARIAMEVLTDKVRQAPYSRSVDITTSNSPTAQDYLIPGTSPFVTDLAFSTGPMEGERLARLRAAGRDVIHIPLFVSALSLGTTAAYSQTWRERLNMNARVAAGIFDRKIDGRTMEKWNDPAITALQGGCGITNTPIHPDYLQGGNTAGVYRGDRSAETVAFTSWLQVRSGGAYNRGASEIYPNIATGNDGRYSAEEAARTSTTNWFDSITNMAGPPGVVSGSPRLGYTNHAYARRFHLVEAAVENAPGDFVLPTPEAVERGARELVVGSDGTARIDWTRPPVEGAYPLVMVTYAIVPTTIARDRGDVVFDFAAMTLSASGEKALTDVGFFPLSPQLRAAAERNLAKIPSTANQPPATTTTTTTTTTPASSAPATSATAGLAGSTGGPVVSAEASTAAGERPGAGTAAPGSAAQGAGGTAAGGTESSGGGAGAGGEGGSGGSLGEAAQDAALGAASGALNTPTAPTADAAAEVRPIVGDSFAGSVFSLSVPLVFVLGCLVVAFGRLEQLLAFASRVRSAVKRR